MGWKLVTVDSPSLNQEQPKEERIQSESEIIQDQRKVITLWTGNEFRIFANHTLEQVQEWHLERHLKELKQIYLPHTFQWVETHRNDLELEVRELEERIDSYVLSEANYDEFKSLLQSCLNYHKKALRLYKEHAQGEFFPEKLSEKENEEFFFLESNKKGGATHMGITIEAQEPIETGLYDVTIVKIDKKDGKFGTSVQITFELPDGRSVNGFFPPKATLNNKAGRLFEKDLGKLETANSDELLGKTVKVFIETNQRHGTTNTNISKIL
jgi:hypothetical protein